MPTLSCHTLPSFSMGDLGQRRLVDVCEHEGQLSIGSSVIGKRPNRPNIIIGQLGLGQIETSPDALGMELDAASLTRSAPTFRYHVCRVIGSIPLEQMIRTNTGWIVTSMTNNLVIGQGSDIEAVGDSMGSFLLLAVRDNRVPVWPSIPLPSRSLPTSVGIIGFDHTMPELGLDALDMSELSAGERTITVLVPRVLDREFVFAMLANLSSYQIRSLLPLMLSPELYTVGCQRW